MWRRITGEDLQFWPIFGTSSHWVVIISEPHLLQHRTFVFMVIFEDHWHSQFVKCFTMELPQPVFTDLCPSQWEFKHNQYLRLRSERLTQRATPATLNTLKQKEIKRNRAILILHLRLKRTFCKMFLKNLNYSFS